MSPIINRVASSSLVVFDLEEYYPAGERVVLDLKERLIEGLVLREKDFRNFISNHDWASYTGKYLAITCTADAIIPHWAYMLAALSAQPFARRVVTGTLEQLELILFREAFDQVDWTKYRDARVVVKGCNKFNIPSSVYAEVAVRLRPLARSVMYGEPCSTVPLYKSSR